MLQVLQTIALLCHVGNAGTSGIDHYQADYATQLECQQWFLSCWERGKWSDENRLPTCLKERKAP